MSFQLVFSLWKPSSSLWSFPCWCKIKRKPLLVQFCYLVTCSNKVRWGGESKRHSEVSFLSPLQPRISGAIYRTALRGPLRARLRCIWCKYTRVLTWVFRAAKWYCVLFESVCDHMIATHCPTVPESLSIHKVPVNWSLKLFSIRGFSCSDADRKLDGSF